MILSTSCCNHTPMFCLYINERGTKTPHSSVLLLNVVAHIYSGPPRFHLYQKTQEAINAAGSPHICISKTQYRFCNIGAFSGEIWLLSERRCIYFELRINPNYFSNIPIYFVQKNKATEGFDG
jgi:hypothetical protein